MNRAKEATREYHQNLYSRAELFEKGTWLEESDELLLKIAEENFAGKENVRVLDIGSGMGRNAIPIAQLIAPRGGTVTCIDFLDIAVEKLKANAQKYRVSNAIEAKVHDLENYPIETVYFDLVIAFSSLEHGVSSSEKFFKVIERIQQGTKPGGINYLGITTNLEELDAETKEALPSDIEYRASYDKAASDLQKVYRNWEVLVKDKSPYEEQYVKNGRMIIWKNDFLTFIAKKKEESGHSN